MEIVRIIRNILEIAALMHLLRQTAFLRLLKIKTSLFLIKLEFLNVWK